MSSRTPRRWTRWPSGSRTSSRGTTGLRASVSDQLLAVLNAVTKAANWQPRVSGIEPVGRERRHAAAGSPGRTSTTRSTMAQTAAIADIEVNKKTGKITVKHVYQAAERRASPSIPAGSRTRSSADVQVVSCVLVEQIAVQPDERHERRLRQLPDPALQGRAEGDADRGPVGRDADPYAAGVGEPVAMAAPAAVANAFFDATGVRMRTAPFTPARVRAALKAAGVA